MRWLVRHVWRAFPELDRFSDEQCDRFVKSARRGRWGRVRDWVVPTAFVLAMSGASLYAIDLIVQFARLDLARGTLLIPLLMGLVPLSVWLIAGFFVRDWLLRRAIRRVINDRGRCVGCGYSLLGLSVPENLRVLCPECGTSTEVDVAMGELSTDEQGRASFVPRERIAHKPWLSRRAWKRTGLGVAALALVSAGVWVGLWWWGVYTLSQQAKRAQGEMASSEIEYAKLVSARRGEGDNAALLVAELNDRLFAARLAGVTDPEIVAQAGGRPVYTDWNLLGHDAGASPSTLAFGQEQQHHWTLATRKAYERFMSPETLALLDRLGSAGIYTQPAPISDPKVVILAQSAPITLVPVIGSCLRIASSAANLPDFVRAMRAAITLNRLMLAQPSVFGCTSAMAHRSDLRAHMRRVLAKAPTADWLDALEPLAFELDYQINIRDAIEAERLQERYRVALVFSDTTLLSQAHIGIAAASARGETFEIGTLEQNLAEIDVNFGRPSADTSIPGSPPPERLYLLQQSRGALFGMGYGSNHLDDLDRASLRLLFALERYRLAKRDYPGTLDALVPTFCAQLPSDPFSGRPFAYKRIDPRTDPHARSFLLYTFGTDGQDDGGKTTQTTDGWGKQGVLWERGHPGYDFVINDPDR